MSAGAADADDTSTDDTSYASKAGPAGTRFAEVRLFTRLDSTNRYLADVARAAPRRDLVAVAEYQTAGRGRLDRRWEAPPGDNLLTSVLLLPDLSVDELHLCSVAVGLAAADACRRAAGLDPSLKWPNDLVAGACKLGGILAESVPLTAPPAADGSPRRAVVVGLGLNVRWPPPDGRPGAVPVPDELAGSATSIWRETGTEVEVGVVLELVLTELERRLTELDDPWLRPRLVREYRERCATVGVRVRARQAHGDVVGTAVDVTPEGHLVLDTESGSVTITVGDVVHLDPAG